MLSSIWAVWYPSRIVVMMPVLCINIGLLSVNIKILFTLIKLLSTSYRLVCFSQWWADKEVNSPHERSVSLLYTFLTWEWLKSSLQEEGSIKPKFPNVSLQLSIQRTLQYTPELNTFGDNYDIILCIFGWFLWPIKFKWLLLTWHQVDRNLFGYN